MNGRKKVKEKGNLFKRRRSFLWAGVERTTARLYDRIIRSPIGKAFTSYRSINKGIVGGGHDVGRINSMSRVGRTVFGAMEAGSINNGLSRLVSALASVPANFYGLLCFIPSMLALIFYYILPLLKLTLPWGLSVAVGNPNSYIAIMLLSIPFILTGRPFARVIGDSALMRLIFVRFLCIPKERIAARAKRSGPLYWLLFLTPLLGAVALFFSPWYLPIGLILLGALCMVMTFPEAGVILATAMLPFIWLNGMVVYAVSGVIAAVWLSYIIKLARMQRRIKFDLLDAVVLIFGALLLFGGFTGSVVSLDTVRRGATMFMLLSVYFLIVNLMKQRAQLKRCLVGVGATLLLCTVLGFAGLIDGDGMNWMKGSIAGDAVADAYFSAVNWLKGINVDTVLLLAFALPLLYSAFFRCEGRPLKGVGVSALLISDVALIILSWSRGVWVCALIGLALFLLLYSHVTLAVGVISVPLAACFSLWYTIISSLVGVDVIAIAGKVLSHGNAGGAVSSASRADLWDSAWRMICDHPAGVGVGSESMHAVFLQYAPAGAENIENFGNVYIDILVSLGFPGLIVFAAMAFLFVQKCLSGLRYTATRRDRKFILGGFVAVAGFLMLGVVRSIGEHSGVFYAVCTVVAVVSAHVNLTFAEADVLKNCDAGDPDSTERQDRVFKM